MYGEVAEWSKAHAWKACIPLKGIVGSNPTLSAHEKNPNFKTQIDNNKVKNYFKLGFGICFFLKLCETHTPKSI